ncbi:MAG: TolC family protein [Bacteroides sp.]|nr:TolC family protein [Bacteroides sp.]
MKIYSSIRKSIGALFLLSLPVSAGAVSIEQALESFCRSSLSIESDSLQMISEIAESSTLANFSDPEIEGERLWSSGGGENKWNASLSWSFDWPGAYKARRDEGEALRLAAMARYYASRRGKMREMAEGVNSYIAARRKIQLLEKQLEATERMGELVSIMSEHGRATVLDESKISIERGRLMAAIQQQRDAMGEGARTIGAVVGQRVDAYLEEQEIEFDLAAPGNAVDWEQYWRNSPDMMLASMEFGVAEAGMKRVKSESFPEISLGYIHAYEEGSHFNGGRIGISLPLFSQRGRKKAARLQVESAEGAMLALMGEKRVEAERMVERLQGLKRSLDELGPVFDTTSPEMLLRKSFEAGQITLLTYLTERNYYLEAEMDYIELQSSYSSLMTQLRLL